MPIVALIFCCLSAAAYGKDGRTVVIADPYIELHTGPGSGYPIFHVADRGEQLVVSKRRTNWFRVRTQDGKKGWVSVDQLARTLDLDLLLYDDCVLSDERLQIPRAEIEQYAFVLQPLADIAPTARHPLLHITYEDMWSAFDRAKVAQHVVPFAWQPTPRPR